MVSLTDYIVKGENWMEQNRDDGRMLGAMLRIPFQATVTRIFDGLSARGYTDLRPAHFAVFQHLAPDGSRITELADEAQITKQSMSALVSHVEACGYVEYAPDPKDGRAKIVRLTERGWALNTAAREIMQETEREWAGVIGAERFVQLKETLKELVSLLTLAPDEAQS